jgi:hypothetical protein
MDLTEEDVQYALQLNQTVRRSLEADGLDVEASGKTAS